MSAMMSISVGPASESIPTRPRTRRLAAATKTFQSYESSITQLNTQQSTLQLSKQLAELSLQRFQLNSATSVEVREAQKSFEEAGFRLVNLQYVAKIAEIELLRLSNQLH